MGGGVTGRAAQVAVQHASRGDQLLSGSFFIQEGSDLRGAVRDGRFVKATALLGSLDVVHNTFSRPEIQPAARARCATDLASEGVDVAMRSGSVADQSWAAREAFVAVQADTIFGRNAGNSSDGRGTPAFRGEPCDRRLPYPSFFHYQA